MEKVDCEICEAGKVLGCTKKPPLQREQVVGEFTEGVDIPCVNQVIMLRATKSAIIFVQQLGRGLRKYNDKEYIVVINFVGNYDKAEGISATINYKDRFLSPSQIIAISKPGKTKKSSDVVQAYNSEKDNVEMSLFVRKNKDDKGSKEFYFLGKINTIGEPKEFIMENTDKRAVEITYKLHTPVREDLYRYIV